MFQNIISFKATHIQIGYFTIKMILWTPFSDNKFSKRKVLLK